MKKAGQWKMSDKRTTLTRVFKKNEITLAYLFGSQRDAGLNYLYGEKAIIDETSDLDIGILMKTPPLSMYKFYGSIYSDVATIFDPFNIDIVFLHEVNFLLKFEIIKGHRIYAADEKFADDYEENVMRFASDLSFKRKISEEDFLEALKNGYFEIELK